MNYMFKYFIFVQGLNSSKNAENRSRILTEIEQDPKLTLQVVSEERRRILNLRNDTVRD